MGFGLEIFWRENDDFGLEDFLDAVEHGPVQSLETYGVSLLAWLRPEDRAMTSLTTASERLLRDLTVEPPGDLAKTLPADVRMARLRYRGQDLPWLDVAAFFRDLTLYVEVLCWGDYLGSEVGLVGGSVGDVDHLDWRLRPADQFIDLTEEVSGPVLAANRTGLVGAGGVSALSQVA